ncbi:MAG: hypothetical protein GF331_22355 [Chitinivibrionales bacterium]|nr:hypothetical protein [Chitinivibrionales bacterium]
MRHHIPLLLASLMLAAPVPPAAQTHPRLLFSPGDIADIRNRREREPFASMIPVIENEALTASDWVTDYVDDHRAVSCGFMYILTGNAQWADNARTHVEAVLASGQWAANVKGLRLYMHGKAVALTYDFCYDAWDSAFRSRVSTALKTHADYIEGNGGREQNTNPASNWQGNRFASGGLCYLATDDAFEQSRLDNCWERVQRYCRENMGDDIDSRGWNIEGIGYTTYPFGQFVGPFGIAMYNADQNRDIRTAVPSAAWTPWTVYAGAARIRNHGEWNTVGLHPDFGDDNPHLISEGVYGQAFWYCPRELVPGLKYWYDRMTGNMGPADFDHVRHGTIYGYLFYPESISAVDPLAIETWRNALIETGGNGYQVFRNQYRDSTDMIAQFYAKLRGNKGHNGPDALSFRIFGHNCVWAVGGGRYGRKINNQDAYFRNMNTLYPVNPMDILAINGNAGRIVAARWDTAGERGYVIADIDKNNVGTTGQKRWFVSDYSRAAGVDAVYVVADISIDGLYWLMCTLEPHAVTTGADTFTITGADGASMKGTVLYPENVSIETGLRERGSDFGYQGTLYRNNRYIQFGGAGNYLVVMTVAQSGQQHPAVGSENGVVLNARVTVGPRSYGIRENDVSWDGSVDPVGSVPAAPSSLTASPVEHYPETNLAWVDNADDEQSFTIYRSIDGETFVPHISIGEPDVTSVTDFALTPGTTYHYRILASNTAGASAFSNTAVTTVPAADDWDVVAYDSFEEVAGPRPLSLAKTGHGWGASWDVNNSDIEYVGDNPLAANGIHGGNYAVRVGYGAGYTSGIRLTPTVVSRNDALWLSVLVRQDTGSESDGDGVGVWNTYRGKDLWNWYHVFRKPDSWTVTTGYKHATTVEAASVPGVTSHAVLKATPDSLFLWIDPTTEDDTPLLIRPEGWRFDNVVKLDGVGLSNRNRYEPFLVDRMVLGTTFSAVTRQFEPVPDPLDSIPLQTHHCVARTRGTPHVRFGRAIHVTLSNSDAHNIRARLLSPSGRTVASAPLASGNGTIRHGALPTGVYLLVIEGTGGVVSSMPFVHCPR